MDWRGAGMGGSRCGWPVTSVVQGAASMSEGLDGTTGVNGTWCNLPSRANPRLTIPRGPRSVATASLAMYHPGTSRGVCGWQAARLLGRLGGFRLFPSGDPPPEEVLDALAPYLNGERRLAVSPRPNHPGRHIALILGAGGECELVAKVATVDLERRKLRDEEEALREIAPSLPRPMSAPAIVSSEPSVLMLKAIPWGPRLRPWVLPPDVASAMGTFFGGGFGGTRPAHGDFAPWNLLRSPDSWVLLDWEEATTDAHPFFDVLHFLVQGHALLGHPSRRALLRGLAGAGAVGAALSAYARSAGLDIGGARSALIAYLDWSIPRQDRDVARLWQGRQVRQELLRDLRR